MQFYLDDMEVDSPINADALTLLKARDRVFRGFLLTKLGYLNGVGDLRFEQGRAVALLVGQLKKKGARALTRFRIESGPGVVDYDGFVDYGTFRYDGRAVSVGLKDKAAVFDLKAQTQTLYGIAPTQPLMLESIRLGGIVQLRTDPNALVLQRKSKLPQTLNQSVPLTRAADSDKTVAGTLVPVVTPLGLDPFYRNTTEASQFMRLNGVVAVAVTLSSSAPVSLMATSLSAGGGLVSEIELGRYTATTAATGIRVLIDCRLEVPSGGSLRLWWRSDTLVTGFIFSYTAPGSVGATLVSVNDEPPATKSLIRAIRAHDLLAVLVGRASGGALTVGSDFFASGAGAGFLLLSGANLRGVNTPLNTSLQAVFEGLSALFNLSLWVENDQVRIEARNRQRGSVTPIREAFSYQRVLARDYLYSQVQTGFVVWQGSSVLAGEEPAGSHSYSTGVTSLKNPLDLRSSLIGATTLIEEQRRRGLSGSSDALDNSLFILQAKKSGAGWVAVTGSDGRYNPALGPAQSLARWVGELSGSGPLRLETVLGAAAPFPLPAVSTCIPFLDTIETPMTMAEFGLIGERIQVEVVGMSGAGELLSAQWQKKQTGDIATLTLLRYE